MEIMQTLVRNGRKMGKSYNSFHLALICLNWVSFWGSFIAVSLLRHFGFIFGFIFGFVHWFFGFVFGFSFLGAFIVSFRITRNVPLNVVESRICDGVLFNYEIVPDVNTPPSTPANSQSKKILDLRTLNPESRIRNPELGFRIHKS